MKKNIFFFILPFVFLSNALCAQIEKVIVETYYVSDTLDVTDTIDGAARALPVGSKTYRVYIDLAKGSSITELSGTTLHPLKISSTANFFNNVDRPTLYFGYLMGKQYFKNNPTLALDSWLTLGLATTIYNGILKTQDTNGTIRLSTWRGTANISGGILRNNDPSAGIPLTTEDGYIPNATTYTASFNDNGFIIGGSSSGGKDTTVFGDSIVGSKFISKNSYLRQNAGVMGAFPDSNQVLVAQLTTKGTLSFELNVKVKDSTGRIIYYVANNNVNSATPDTVQSPYLTYPPLCGCRDIRYLEYNPSYACGDSTYCSTLKVFGCTDTAACNYDPNANVLLPNFCCYPGLCNDRDISLVCPNIHGRLAKQNTETDIYPNPVQNVLTLQMLSSSTDYKEVTYTIYDSFDRLVAEKDLGVIPANTTLQADVSDLSPGLYLFRVSVQGVSSVKKFIKN